jgi:hypothetical protein
MRKASVNFVLFLAVSLEPSILLCQRAGQAPRNRRRRELNSVVRDQPSQPCPHTTQSGGCCRIARPVRRCDFL